jgi:hypothetical protein
VAITPVPGVDDKTGLTEFLDAAAFIVTDACDIALRRHRGWLITLNTIKDVIMQNGC